MSTVAHNQCKLRNCEILKDKSHKSQIMHFKSHLHEMNIKNWVTIVDKDSEKQILIQPKVGVQKILSNAVQLLKCLFCQK